MIADAAGAVVDRLSYDAWGKRRYSTGAGDPADSILSQTSRGFTGHEMIDDVGLVNMNGRIYDPQIGRFLSADPFIQDPTNAQSLNRYTYVGNNPLSYVDPTGYFIGKIFKAIGSFFKSVFNAIKNIFTNPRALFSLVVGAALFWVLGPAGLAIVGELAAAGIAGGVAGYIATGTIKGAILGAGTAMAAVGVASLNIPTNTASGVAGNVAAYGVVGGTAAELGGGKFRDGFATAAFFYLAAQFTADHILSNGDGKVRMAQADTGTMSDVYELPTITVTASRLPEYGGITGAMAAAFGIGHNGGPALADPLPGGLKWRLLGGASTIALGVMWPSPLNVGKNAFQSEFNRVTDLLRPEGQWVGRPGSNSGIRHLNGGEDSALRMFEQLTVGGTNITPAGYPGQMVRLPNNVGVIGYRPVSKFGPPTIDINLGGGLVTQKLKFPD